MCNLSYNSRSLENPLLFVRSFRRRARWCNIIFFLLSHFSLPLSLFLVFLFNNRFGGSRLFSSKALLYAKTNVRPPKELYRAFELASELLCPWMYLRCVPQVVSEAPRLGESLWIAITRNYPIMIDKFESLRPIVNTLTAQLLVFGFPQFSQRSRSHSTMGDGFI